MSLKTYLLSVIAGGSTNPQTLMGESVGFQGIPPGLLVQVAGQALVQWAEHSAGPVITCGTPTNTIQLTGAGTTGVDGFYYYDGVVYLGFGFVIFDTGTEWTLVDALARHLYNSSYADFPCVWTTQPLGTDPAPSGYWYSDPIPDGSGGFWELIVDSLGNVGTQTAIGPNITTIILSDGVGGFWRVVVDPAGNRGTQSDPGPGTPPMTLTDENFGHWQLVVDPLGNLGAASV